MKKDKETYIYLFYLPQNKERAKDKFDKLRKSLSSGYFRSCGRVTALGPTLGGFTVGEYLSYVNIDKYSIRLWPKEDYYRIEIREEPLDSYMLEEEILKRFE